MHVVKKKKIIMIIQGFPCLPLQEAQVRSLIREVPCPGTAWPKKKKKKKSNISDILAKKMKFPGIYSLKFWSLFFHVFLSRHILICI